MHRPQLASAVLMVRPRHFRGNEQTATDNRYQQGVPTEVARPAAQREFAAAVEALSREGIRVLVLDEGGAGGTELPDAIFPNNWIATASDGTVTTFPMAWPNRRAELAQLPAVLDLFRREGYGVSRVHPFERDAAPGEALEGTGSLVLDHARGVAYAALSPRTHPRQVERFAEQHGYQEVHVFHAIDGSGDPVYHTNVVMSIGQGISVICMDAVVDAAERDVVAKALQASGEVICISRRQMNESFCANLLYVRDQDSAPALVLSRSAWEGFTPAEQAALARYGRPIVLDIPMIERVGGGSARCMLAEVFLPRAV